MFSFRIILYFFFNVSFNSSIVLPFAETSPILGTLIVPSGRTETIPPKLSNLNIFITILSPVPSLYLVKLKSFLSFLSLIFNLSSIFSVKIGEACEKFKKNIENLARCKFLFFFCNFPPFLYV